MKKLLTAASLSSVTDDTSEIAETSSVVDDSIDMTVEGSSVPKKKKSITGYQMFLMQCSVIMLLKNDRYHTCILRKSRLNNYHSMIKNNISRMFLIKTLTDVSKSKTSISDQSKVASMAWHRLND
ncbi:uncharacterized protein LOC130649097 [Hydractinia symbiolongicarpus]|uniref:uncharacterized protein LOC130649097 n=1 Tax=Hydractinia symbiolongicarpus TaxID=13093 RepID=UPI00254B1302|nr:uncharacterized protein LOC130649097 [Hydractinia symbiolongicarpus]XP_057311285.1 uncharacterized protein LOC130649097 [Hydractinia symbiolongicarpus]